MAKRLFLCGISLLAAAPMAVHAQEGEPTSGGGLEDLVITAQKRSERLQDVPIAVSAFNGASLASAGVQTSANLELLVPNLSYTSIAGYAMPFLRGIGTDLTQPNSDPSVATYVDGAYVANNESTIVNLLGVERIEVLKGPQGTLYGRNATGGAINIITLSPGDELSAAAKASYGNYNAIEAAGHVSGPISDTLSVGIYAAGTRRRSYIRNVIPDLPQQRRHETSWGVRAKFVYDNQAGFKLTGSVEALESNGSEATWFRQIQPNALGYAFGAPVVNRKRRVSIDAPSFNNPRQIAATLREEGDLGFAQLLGISSWRKTRVRQADDFDATSAPVIQLSGKPDSEQFSQELQLLSNEDSKIKWIAGLYFFREKGGFTPNRVYSPILFAGTGFNTTESFASVRTTSIAAFAQATIPIGDSVRLTAGGRITRDHKLFYGGKTRFLNVTTTPVLAYTPGDLVSVTEFPDAKKTWTRFTPKLTIDYRTGGTLLYATYGTGFKAGVFNVTSPATPGPADPEKLQSFEIGTKSDLAGGNIHFNTALFYYDFKDLQVQTIDPTASGSTILQNSGRARVLGAEAEFIAAVTRELQVNASLGYLHTRYKDFENFAGVAPAAFGNMSVPIDVSGNDMQRAPHWTISAGVKYSKEIAGGGRIGANADFYYNSGFSFEPSNQIRNGSYRLVNALISYTTPGGHVEASAWVRNIFSESYYLTGNISAFGTIVTDSMPRSYGVTLSWTY